MADRILVHLPPYYEGIRDFVEIDSTESIELDLMQGAVDQLFDDQFVMTAGLHAVKRREQMLGIQADPTTETLDFRRRRIANRYQTKPPFTIRCLQQHLDLLVGVGMTIVTVDAQAYLLTITANVDNASVFREVLHTVETIKPANLIYQQNTALGGNIELEERISRREVIFNYGLNGLWKLGENPFMTLGTEVVVK